MFHTNPEFNFPLFTLFKISWPGEEGNEVAAGAGRALCSYTSGQIINMFKYLLLVLSIIATPLDGLSMVFKCDNGGGPCIPAPADRSSLVSSTSLVLSSIATPAKGLSAS